MQLCLWVRLGNRKPGHDNEIAIINKLGLIIKTQRMTEINHLIKNQL